MASWRCLTSVGSNHSAFSALLSRAAFPLYNMSRVMGTLLSCILTMVASLTWPSIPRCASGKCLYTSLLTGILPQYFLGAHSGMRSSNLAGCNLASPSSFPFSKFTGFGFLSFPYTALPAPFFSSSFS